MSELTEILALEIKDVQTLNYEAARDLLDQVVTALDDSALPLGSLMKLWELGEEIAKVCQNHLTEAAKRIDEKLASE